MTTVDPLLIPIPAKIRNDKDLRPFFESLIDIIRQIRDRTGGSVDKIENIEVTQVLEDGGNRNSRFIVDDIAHLQSQIDSLKRSNRALQSEVYESRCEISSVKRERNKLIDQVHELMYKEPVIKNIVNEYIEEHNHTTRNTYISDYTVLKTNNRRLENKLYELEERIDSGV